MVHLAVPSHCHSFAIIDVDDPEVLGCVPSVDAGHLDAGFVAVELSLFVASTTDLASVEGCTADEDADLPVGSDMIVEDC